MEVVDLEPNGYGGTYKLVGGRLALDFINTVSWPGREREHDWLSCPANLDRWCHASDLPAGPIATASDLANARRLRADIGAALTPLAFGEHPPEPAIERLNRRLSTAASRQRLDGLDLSRTWLTPSNAFDRLAPVVLDAADVVVAADHDRLRHCDACDWLFDDRSRNGRRRWCDMADCGSRAKSRSYYHRTRS